MANHDHFELIKQRFGHPEFRPLQREAIEAALGGRDSLVVMPTGGGKSLCYQGPAVALGGLTVVVSPLIALMEDQLAALRSRGVAAVAIHSHDYRHKHDEALARIRAGCVNLLYVAPERVLSPSMITLLAKVHPLAFVIDECHCVSTWGHDFRPDYRRLVELRKVFPRAAFHAFTATATPLMRSDIIDALALRNPVQLVGAVHRPNLALHVVERCTAYEDSALLMSIMNCCVGKTRGIVYANTKKHVEKIYRDLQALEECRPVMYHADIAKPLRLAAQQAFTSGDANVVVATIAFGMGIDVPDIRFVFHARMPESLERYHQEIGRAGRDGQASDCVIFHHPDDYDINLDLLDHSEAPNGEERMIALQSMADYIDIDRCRAAFLSDHFGQSMAFPCHLCDVCLRASAPSPLRRSVASSLLPEPPASAGGITNKPLLQETPTHE